MEKLKLLFFSVAIFGIAVAASAASTVRTDRVWEHYSSYFCSVLFQSRFDGTTDLNGKQYHNLVVTQKIFSNWGFTNMSDASDEETFFMREENGVVYLVRNADWRDEYSVCSTPPGDEMVICDFNCEAGESFHSISAITWIGQYGSYIREFYENTFDVAKTDSIEINGELCKRLFIGKVTNPLGEEKVFAEAEMPIIVEGLMGVNGGIFPVMSAMTKNYRDSFDVGRLTKAYDLSGNIIYDGYEPPLHKMDLSVPSMLVDDYKWEYWLSSADGKLNQLVSLKFDGERDVDGKTYRVLNSQREAEWKYGDGLSIEYVDRELKVFNKEYLLREKDGKVYLYNDGSYGYDGIGEFMVYDFTLTRTFMTFGTEANCYPGCEEDPSHRCSVMPKVFKVKNVVYTRNGDEDEFRKIYSLTENVFDDGLGGDLIRYADDAACFVSILPFTQFKASPENRFTSVKLNNVYDNEGKIVFVGENEVVPEDSYVPLIREDRVWEYVYFSSPWEYNPELWQVKFDGTEIINDKVYHVFKPISCLTKDADASEYNKITDFSEDTYQYLREEYGKVYSIHPRTPNYDDWDYDILPPKEEWEETLLYDFRQNAGGHFWITATSPSSYFYDWRMLMSIGSTERMDIDGESCKVLHDMRSYSSNIIDSRRNIYCEEDNWYYDYFFGFNLVEGVGFDGIGTMTFIPADITTNGDPDVHLNNVYNGNGDIVYKGWDVKVTNGIIEEFVDPIKFRHEGESWLIENVTNVAVYDLQGKELTIKNGNGTKSTVKLSSEDYQPGFYIVKASSGSGSKVRKIRI